MGTGIGTMYFFSRWLSVWQPIVTVVGLHCADLLSTIGLHIVAILATLVGSGGTVMICVFTSTLAGAAFVDSYAETLFVRLDVWYVFIFLFNTFVGSGSNSTTGCNWLIDIDACPRLFRVDNPGARKIPLDPEIRLFEY